MERTPEEYIAKLVAGFREVRRVLRSDGVCWVNLGDSYAASWPCPRRNEIGAASLQNGKREARPARLGDSIKNKDLVGIPWMVAFALRADGWWLRQDIIWSKSNPMPESVTDRCTKSHEYIFLLTKAERYFYDAEAVKEAAIADHPAGNTSHRGADLYEAGDERHRTKQGLVAYAKRNGRNSFRGQGADRDSAAGPANRDGRDMSLVGIGATRNKRSVWNIATSPFPEAHFATIGWQPTCKCGTTEVAPCTVLDPFSGAGTTGLVATRLGRDYIGIELNKDYIAMSERRIVQDAPLFNTPSGEFEPKPEQLTLESEVSA